MRAYESSHRPTINILVLAASKLPQEHTEQGYPICLTEIGGVSVLEHIFRNSCSLTNAQYAFTFLNSEVQRFHLEKIAALIAPGALCVKVPEQTQGSACTALLTACQLVQEAELLIISANELVDIDIGATVREFRGRKLDAGTLIFRSLHPRYSYVVLDEDGSVIEAAQRQPISANATAGVFWFAKTYDFVEGAKNLIRKDAHVDNSYFVAPTFNELILKQKRIGVTQLPLEKYIPLKTERQVEHYEEIQR
jgi:hypothetical protein